MLGRGEQDFTIPWKISIIAKAATMDEPVISTRGDEPNFVRSAIPDPAQPFVIYSAVLDATDNSHLTIRYALGEQIGHIDARLKENFVVDVAIRDGPWFEDYRNGK